MDRDIIKKIKSVPPIETEHHSKYTFSSCIWRLDDITIRTHRACYFEETSLTPA